VSARFAPVVSLDAARARRRAGDAPAAPPATLQATPGRVLLAFADGSEVDLSPEHARTWAERLLAMADAAEITGGRRGL
jgi:hypothetical protein